MNQDLFLKSVSEAGQEMADAPLAERLRPQVLDDIVGQDHLVGPGAPLRVLIESDRLPSMIFWGPPGFGQDNAGSGYCRYDGRVVLCLLARLPRVSGRRGKIIARAREERRLGRRTIFFVDEIHRFNKAQQDAFLPHVENGVITLIGATTENPSFEVNSALLSRTRVFVLNLLDTSHIRQVLDRAIADSEHGFPDLQIDDQALDLIAETAEGDARRSLNALETVAAAVEATGCEPTPEAVREILGRKAHLYDKTGEEHYNIISAFHKSLRGSNPHASLYWLARMMTSGEHPHYILRRMIRFASEDVGVADPRALQVALNAREAYDFLGSPEGDLAIAQATVYLATAPKSNAVYAAYNNALSDVEKHPNLPVPLHIRNAPTKLMKDLDYGKGYQYAHDDPDGYIDQVYFPDNLRDRTYYHPTDRGYEKHIHALMDWWDELRKKKSF